MISTKILICIIIHSCLLWVSDSASSDTLHQDGTLNSSQTLISTRGNFSLGFFSIERYSGSTSYKSWYLGISYINFPAGTNETNTVWIANRDRPIDSDYGILTLDSTGKLMISHRGGDHIELYKGSGSAAFNTSATLLNNGNFVLTEMNSNGSAGRVLWQSFDYPTDTLLPGMKLGVNHKTGVKWSLTSRLAEDAPESGAFTLEWDPKGVQLVMRRRGVIYWNSGAIKSDSSGGGTYFDFVSREATSIYDLKNVTNEDEEYFTYSVNNEYDEEYRKGKSKMLLDWKGLLQDADRLQIINVEECYGYNTDGGCVKWEQPKCRGSNMKFETRSGGFIKPAGDYYLGMSDFNDSLSRSDCRAQCWTDCDCVGFMANRGPGCLYYIGKDLKFEQDYSGSSVSLDLLVKNTLGGKKESRTAAIIAVSVAVPILAILCYIGWKLQGYIQIRKDNNETHLELDILANDLKKGGHNLEVYSFACIVEATNNYSLESKLGEGGFGPVYKGKLPEGHEIAVKRLSGGSAQGFVEFKNELLLISRLQHVNLVRLLGCCIHKEEKMLVYEYLSNKSLDYFLFDPSKRKLLDWTKRVNIIDGIAQGLLYLHKYSRLKIIHRDLKASNILLDENMNPKISDFGLARIFKQNELKANTNRVVGTYGYMSPEYAMEGIFSIKSDVYSFGVLLLEIVSGRKNNSFNNLDGPLNLVGYAWDLWQKGAGLEVMDHFLKDSCSEHQLLRYIHVGLACVEDYPVDRPKISEVVPMLTNESWPLPVLKKPAYLTQRLTAEEIENNPENLTVNGLSISAMNPR